MFHPECQALTKWKETTNRLQLPFSDFLTSKYFVYADLLSEIYVVIIL